MRSNCFAAGAAVVYFSFRLAAERLCEPIRQHPAIPPIA